MSYLLDTDTIIYWMKGKPEVVEKVVHHRKQGLAASVITRAELYFGAYRSQHVERNIAAVDGLAKTIAFLGLSEQAQRLFGQIKARLYSNGTPLADSDTLIAATAIAEDRTLVTNNLNHFERVPDLRLENWLVPSKR